MSMGFSSLMFLLLLLMGGRGSLSEHLDVEGYWEDLGVPWTAEALRAEFGDAPRDLPEYAPWVAQLGAASYEKREEASRKLSEAGVAVRPLLEQAAESRDPEVAQRAKRLLDGLPAVESDRREERQWMAVLGLARMEGPEAEAALSELAESGPPEIRELIAGLREPRGAKGEGPKVPAGAAAVLRIRPGAGSEDLPEGMWRSPELQRMLRDGWMKTGPLRIDRITVCTDAALFGSPGDMAVSMVLEGRFDPERLTGLIAGAGGRIQERDGVREAEFLGFKLELVDRHQIRLRRGEFGARGGDIPKLVERLREEDPVAGTADLPPDLPGELGDLGPAKRMDLRMARGADGWTVRVEVGYADPAEAEPVRELLRKEMQQIDGMLAGEAEAAPFRTVVRSVAVEIAEGNLVATAEISDDVLRGLGALMERMHVQRREMMERHRGIRLRHQAEIMLH